MVATITLNSNAALPTVTGGDTLLFVYSGQAEYWVKFLSTPPCAGYGEVIQFKPGQAPKCIIKTGGGATPTNITFTYGPGVYGSPLPPGGPFPARALPCKFGCP